jgi:hypothetical protein
MLPPPVVLGCSQLIRVSGRRQAVYQKIEPTGWLARFVFDLPLGFGLRLLAFGLARTKTENQRPKTY